LQTIPACEQTLSLESMSRKCPTDPYYSRKLPGSASILGIPSGKSGVEMSNPVRPAATPVFATASLGNNSMSVLVILGQKCTMPHRVLPPGESRLVCADGTERQTDRRTPDRYITLSARRG